MKQLILSISLIGILWADGGFIPPPGNVEIYSADQVALIKILPGAEELSILVKAHWVQNYGGFAWVVPLPALPQVDQVEVHMVIQYSWAGNTTISSVTTRSVSLKPYSFKLTRLIR
jgi:hypothetical protein